MSELTRIDQYICIDTDQIVVDEMRGIIDNDCTSKHQEDLDSWAELQQAAKIILKNYVWPSALEQDDE